MHDEAKSFTGSYRQPINYENGVLLPKLRDISLWRDVDIKAYESGVVTLALFLPKDLRSKALAFFEGDTVKEDLTMDGKKDFDDILAYILTLLEDNGIAFPKSRFEKGHG
jgi:hypothetical protein